MTTQEALPAIDFATFIMSLGHSALMHLGQAPHPETNQVEVHLDLARQTIDLIALLEQKTKGNLTGDEERLVGQMVSELRMKFVELSKTQKI